ncbi:xanthine dehydrogenase family protein subunit M [Mumia sp. ZJ1417]|uniref:FAD binding domain-containing protein n=1 Tax=Mumia sp. ZJ1417 TaxID=2708082 RepID=UPI00142106CE|nr:xanthine dehydrogenase family protein subunit M [Mumia sp. ZJ1417]QMW67290.1 xanthine dehydrogenase family protein subunit M [Mumia sp. ZJ1417]
MKPAPFSYVRPATLDEALAVLAADPHAKVLAGGQSLVPLLSMRLAQPSTLVDINGLAELAYVRTDEDGVRIGALARHADVESDADAWRVQPLLRQALRLVAHPTIRNRGTTLGSVVHADAAAEMPAVVSLLGAKVLVASTEGRRTIDATDLFIGPLECTVRTSEVALELQVPALGARTGSAIDEVARRHGDYALCGVASVVSVGQTGAIETVRASYLSVSLTPLVLDLSEAFIDGTASDANLEAAVEIATAGVDPDTDIHATADYRRHLAGVLTRRVVRDAYSRAVAPDPEGAR